MIIRRGTTIIIIFLVFLANACKKDNLGPIIELIINPSWGDTETLFLFDASNSNDDNDNFDMLQIRWDWDNNNSWDTSFSNDFITDHKFNNPGNYTIRLEIKDSDGLSSIFLKQIEVFETGPFYRPIMPYPVEQSINNNIFSRLRWKCYSKEISDIKYDIYLGKVKNPPLIEKNYNSDIYDPDILENSTEYYWRIVAKDDQGNIRLSPIWSFSTSLWDKRDGKEYNVVKIGQRYWMAENLNFNTLSGSWCFEDDPKNCEKYGRLYNWQKANESCPDNWHLSTEQDWLSLEISLFMPDPLKWGPRGDNQGDLLKIGGSSDFNALMSGTRDDKGNYSSPGVDTGFWTAAGFEEGYCVYRWISYYQPFVYKNVLLTQYGLSVRCIKDL